ncbi:hypothetical protein M885DRAFT_527216 [Pelagophyceae sp. CCMP2097]|nr:hypothetical protein M885DRAFT_527216 [Pelagophyceae sp. CCMP2097]
MVSFLASLFGREEDDDPSCLSDVALISVYEAPAKMLGVGLNAKPWEVRDAVRDNALRLLGERFFNGRDKPVLPWKYTALAYLLVSKSLKRVKKAQDLKKLIEEQDLLRGSALDMLHILRPCYCEGVTTHAFVRACAWLTVVYEDYELKTEGDLLLPYQVYKLRVVYCAREHVVHKRYSDFKALNAALEAELTMVPGFPQGDALFKVGLGDYHDRGNSLANYANRVHASLGARGVFSPRLLRFLEIDAARVHVEEDGRVSKMLDSTAAGAGSAWHMVDELWLKKWRKFVLGRGARRYEPPGPLTNERLLVSREATLLHAQATMTDDDKQKLLDRATSVPAALKRQSKATFDVRERLAGFVFAAQAAEKNGPLTLHFDGALPEENFSDESREAATIGVHYRAITYNLWIYWKLCHGGGPCISRKTKDMLSPSACGAGMEARSRLQRFGRGCVAKNQKLALYWRALSRTAPGVREVLVNFAERGARESAERAIRSARNVRTSSRLFTAARYTQRSWRSKKSYAFNDEHVRVMKHAQEIFAAAEGDVESGGSGAFVVEEGERIISLGKSEQYEVRFSERDGPTLPVVLKQHSCSELTFIAGIREGFVENAERRANKQLCRDSVLLVVQGYPVSSLTHAEAMKRVMSSKWPLVLRFERPLLETDVKSWAQVCRLYRDASVAMPLKLQLMKRLLARGVDVVKHGRHGAPHASTLYINETFVFWEQRNARKMASDNPESLSLKYDLSRGCSLYDLKYVRIGKLTPPLKRAGARLDEDKCFSLFSQGRTLDFHVDSVDGDASLAKEGRTTLAWAFDSIVREARGTQIYVDKSGAPIRRKEPKKRLRLIT